MLVLLGLVLLLLAALLAALGALPLRRQRRQQALLLVPPGWVAAPGIVRSERTHVVGSEHSGVVVRQPFVEFRDARGATHTFLSERRGTIMPTPGTPVRVFHHPLDPRQARLDPALVPDADRGSGGVVAGVLAGCVIAPMVLALLLGALAAFVAA